MTPYRDTIPDRCDKSARWGFPNGYRSCGSHVDERAPDGIMPTLYPDTIGPCDYPMDGLGAMPYRRLIVLESRKPAPCWRGLEGSHDQTWNRIAS